MAEICKFTGNDCFEKAEKTILEGGVLVYPTDTLYGLGVDARNDGAIEKVRKIKGRTGPWSVAVSDLAMLRRYARIPLDKRDFVLSHLPGKVTLILPSIQSDLSVSVLGRDNTIGIRIPNHIFPTHLTQRLQFPIITTSVNRSGQTPLNDPTSIKKAFDDQVDLIIDDGPLPPSPGSRIYNLSTSKIEIVRDVCVS